MPLAVHTFSHALTKNPAAAAAANDETVFYQVIKFSGSVFVWIGTASANFDRLVLAVDADLSTPILSDGPGGGGGPDGDSAGGGGDATVGGSLAGRLSARLKKPVYVSLQAPRGGGADPQGLAALEIEKRLVREIKDFPDKF